MTGIHVRFAAALVVVMVATSLAACGSSDSGGATDVGSGTPDLRLAPPYGYDGAGTDSATDTTEGPEDTTTPFDWSSQVEGCEECGYGSVRGRVCAPNPEVSVAGALVWLDVVDCEGNTVHLETISNPGGYYSFEEVPCGTYRLHIEKGSFAHEFPVTIHTGEETDLTMMDYKLCFQPDAARIAIITGDWDTLEYLVERLGLDADVYTLGTPDDYYYGEAHRFLADLAKLQEYDILLINCGEAHYELSQDTGVQVNIRQFVENGGSLYMSDFAYIYSERAWPWAIDFWGEAETEGTMSSGEGPIVMGSESLTGTVVDDHLDAYLGNPGTIPVELGLSPLVSVEGPCTYEARRDEECETDVHVEAPIPQFNDLVQPLVLSYHPTPTSGNVIYTTFHNTEQDMAQMQKVLMYLMFAL